MIALKTMDEQGKDLDMPMSVALRANGSPLQSPLPIAAGWTRGASVRRRHHAKADLNLHAYVGADPVNWTDPEGLAKNEIVITAPPRPQNPPEIHRPGTFGPVSPGAGGNPERGEDNGTAECPDEANCVIVTAKNPPPSPFTRIVRGIGNALDSAAEHIKPPQGRRRNETYDDCVYRVAPEAYDLTAGGLAGVLAGIGLKSLYPAKSSGSGTSVISILSREIFGSRRMSTRRFGTISAGGAVGRILSRGSAVGGSAAAGLGVGKAIGADQICR